MDKEDTNKHWLSEKEAIKYSSLSRTRLKSARKENKITYRLLYGTTVIYHVKDLDNYIIKNSDLYPSIDDVRNKKGGK